MMKIIITQSFEDSFEKYNGKETVSLDIFCEAIHQDIIKEIRYLHRPYLKIKVHINQRSMRILALCYEIEGVIIPIIITDKNDKVYGMNMTRSTIKKIVDNRIPAIESDLIAKRYREYTFS